MQKMKITPKSDLNYSLNLEFFKAKPCPIKEKHNIKCCPFYHTLEDYIRPNLFFSETCLEKEVKRFCSKGDKCEKAHNFWELNYTPENYKKLFCKSYPLNTEKCEFGIFCAFAHNDEDIKIQLIHKFEANNDFFMFHYKTVLCPFLLFEHNRENCVYSHGLLDFRRKPNVVKYSQILCENWKEESFFGKKYEEICKKRCALTHGKLEWEYHPMVFRTLECKEGMVCKRKIVCAGYHENREKRNIDDLVVSGLFSYCEENRQGTIKK